MRVLPDLAGATVADARTRLAALGLALSPAADGKPQDDTAFVEKTVPAAGAVVRIGTDVALALKG
jgi:beta-lactam-binding protein with PASTA domain